MIRLEKADFDSPTLLGALASEAKMTPRQFRERYEPVAYRPNRLSRDHPVSTGMTSGEFNEVSPTTC